MPQLPDSDCGLGRVPKMTPSMSSPPGGPTTFSLFSVLDTKSSTHSRPAGALGQSLNQCNVKLFTGNVPLISLDCPLADSVAPQSLRKMLAVARCQTLLRRYGLAEPEMSIRRAIMRGLIGAACHLARQTYCHGGLGTAQSSFRASYTLIRGSAWSRRHDSVADF